MILKSSINHTQTALILTTVLLSSLLVIVSLARSGTNIFYDTRAKEEESNYKLSKSTLSSIVYLFSFTIILVLFANNITQITENIASNLVDTNSYISTVLNPNGSFNMKDTNSFLPHPILSFMLVIIWLLLNNTVAAGHIVLGIVLAILIPWFTSSFWQRRVYIGSFFYSF